MSTLNSHGGSNAKNIFLPLMQEFKESMRLPLHDADGVLNCLIEAKKMGSLEEMTSFLTEALTKQKESFSLESLYKDLSYAAF